MNVKHEATPQVAGWSTPSRSVSFARGGRRWTVRPSLSPTHHGGQPRALLRTPLSPQRGEGSCRWTERLILEPGTGNFFRVLLVMTSTERPVLAASGRPVLGTRGPQPIGCAPVPAPPVDPKTGEILPGIHETTLDHLNDLLATNYSRRELMRSVRWLHDELRGHGVPRYWIDGSFMTSKWRPSDVDVVYEPPPSADNTTWGILSFPRRAELKRLRKIDLWPYPSYQRDKTNPFRNVTILDWWTTDSDGNAKQVALIQLKGGEQG